MFFELRSNLFKRCAFGVCTLLTTHLACTASTDRKQQSEGPRSIGSTLPDGGHGDSSADVPTTDDHDLTFETGMPTEAIDSCAQTGSEAQPVQLDIIVLLDRSGSMYGTNWVGATSALKQFVQDPASDGINLGILYFPVDAPADNLVCNPVHYQDLAVPLGLLPQHAPNIVQSIDSQLPNGGSTPMYGALEGTLRAASEQQLAQPDHKVIVVFASDGDPNSCPAQQNIITEIAAVVQLAHASSAIETYVIAIAGASLANLDQLAAAGGTTQAYDVTGNVNQFAQKMAEIQASALACEYIIPEPPANEPLELDRVVVKHITADAAQTEIPRAEGKLECGQTAGWYFDDPIQPTRIILCPASCDLARFDKQGRIDVFFGCKPKLN